jgi:hypothetical protein
MRLKSGERDEKIWKRISLIWNPCNPLKYHKTAKETFFSRASTRQRLPRFPQIEPAGDRPHDDARDAVADEIADRARDANEPVDGQHQREADRGDRRDGVQGRREDDDRGSGHAMRAFRGNQRNAEDDQEIA